MRIVPGPQTPDPAFRITSCVYRKPEAKALKVRLRIVVGRDEQMREMRRETRHQTPDTGLKTQATEDQSKAQNAKVAGPIGQSIGNRTCVPDLESGVCGPRWRWRPSTVSNISHPESAVNRYVSFREYSAPARAPVCIIEIWRCAT